MTSIPRETPQWIIANSPAKEVNLTPNEPTSTFRLVKTPLPALKEGQILVEVVALSNDPAQRKWIQKGLKRLYMTPLKEGDVMGSGALARVVESTSTKWKVGDIANCGTGWSQYAIFDEAAARKVQPVEGISTTSFLGVLGGTGLTAYFGLLEVVKATSDDVIVVSGAAGATGSVVVQLAKHVVGCKKVIGIAGGKDKCEYVRQLGADVVIDYKSPDFAQEIEKHTPDYVNVYYDNVGGVTLDLLLPRMANFGRIAACGAISGYNNKEAAVVTNWMDIITNRLEVRGFIVLDYAKQFPEAVAKLVQWVKEGKLKIEGETVINSTFEDIPKSWHKLFEGGNTGKLVTKLRDF